MTAQGRITFVIQICRTTFLREIELLNRNV